MYKMPTKKDKTALEAIEAALDREKAEAKAAAARHKLTVERLRCRVKTLEVGGEGTPRVALLLSARRPRWPNMGVMVGQAWVQGVLSGGCLCGGCNWV